MVEMLIVDAWRAVFNPHAHPHLPFCGLVGFDVEVVEFELELVDVVGVCGWKNGCCVPSPDDGVLLTWNGAKRIGGKDILCAFVFGLMYRVQFPVVVNRRCIVERVDLCVNRYLST